MSSNQSTDVDPYHAYPDEPSVDKFVRRAYHASLVLGDFVYIDGGEIAMLIDDEPVNMLNNDTLTIDLKNSWDTSSAPFGYITKQNVPDLNGGFLFPAPDNKTIFQFGGETNWLFNAWLAPETAIYQFTLTGEGNGTWSKFNAGPNSGFNDLTRPVRALAASVDDTFFIFGGFINSHSSRSTMDMGYDTVPLDGIVAFNMTSGVWTNTSMPSHLIRPHGKNGMLSPVPNFGLAGLLVTAGTGTVDKQPPTFENITIYEPQRQTWHYQTSTGDIPAGRDAPCVVGVQGDNGTYEIFMYGGRVNQNDGELLGNQVQQNIDLDEVYVLSLPAFAWFRADYAAQNSRFFHTCQVVGSRQMMSIGGLNPLDANADKVSQDTAVHGLRIFDLTEMRWSDSYDANAAPYMTPQAVKDWYQQNGTSSVQWNDPMVREFFARSLPAETGPSANTTTTSPNPATSHTSSSHTGAIAGGVIGGLAGICVLAAFIFWFLRRRKQKKASSRPYQHKAEMADTYNVQEFPEESRKFEADNGQQAWEADGMQRMELDATTRRGR
ncbi:MAG: hypothetical protein Q9225_006206 [Loekoesia sp. 1 TL-2023]